MYHATPLSNWRSIKKNGLLPSNNKIYLTETSDAAKDFAIDVFEGYGNHRLRSRRWVLLEVSLNDLVLIDLQRDPDSGERNYYAMVEDRIPPSRIEFVEEFEVGD